MIRDPLWPLITNVKTYCSNVSDRSISGLVISVTWPCFYDGKLLGLVGLDIHAADLVEGVTYFNSPDKKTYAFLIDYRGEDFMTLWYF